MVSASMEPGSRSAANDVLRCPALADDIMRVLLPLKDWHSVDAIDCANPKPFQKARNYK
jgi:hypothetical protein